MSVSQLDSAVDEYVTYEIAKEEYQIKTEQNRGGLRSEVLPHKSYIRSTQAKSGYRPPERTVGDVVC